MRFLSFSLAGRASFGAVLGDRVIDLGARHPELPDLRAALRQQRLRELAREAERAEGDALLTEIQFLPVIPNPEKILCIGMNYRNRDQEYAPDLGRADAVYPSVFMRSRESLVGHEQPILLPPESEQLDYEGEIVLVAGRPGRRIAEAEAHRFVAGMTLMNEGTVRDWLRHGRFNVTQGKNFASSGALGPLLVTADEVDPFTALQIRTQVNGEERQNDNTANLLYPFRYLLAYLSTFAPLQPGDLIATGTPTGAGVSFTPPRFLKPGDRVEVTAPGLGVLSNPVVAEEMV